MDLHYPPPYSHEQIMRDISRSKATTTKWSLRTVNQLLLNTVKITSRWHSNVLYLRHKSSYSLQLQQNMQSSVDFYGSCSVPQSHPSRFNYGRKLAYFSERRSIINFKTLSPTAPTWRPSELVMLNTYVPLHVQTSIYRIQVPTLNQNFKPSCNSFCLLHEVGDNLVTRRKFRRHF